MKAPTLKSAADLPAPVSATLAALVSAAVASLETDLQAIVLFGSAAENRLRSTSDVNVVIVVRRFDGDRVGALGEALLAGRAAVRLNVMWLLEPEISDAVQAFAVKFADIGRRRRVLWGRDPFEQVVVPRGVAIARLRQVLMNLIMRLRAGYALHSRHEDRLALLLADAAGPLRAGAAEMLELEGSSPLPPREALERIVQALPGGPWSDVLAAFHAARETRAVEPGTARPLLLRVIELACQLQARVNGLEPG